MSATLSVSRALPIRHTVDVFVAGGGPAGVAAAVSAARQGASVFLVEGQGCFGGMGTVGMVPAFMQFGDGVNFLAGGVGREVYDRLWDAGGVGPDDVKDAGAVYCSIRAEVLKRVYDAMVRAAGVDFTFHTQLIDVEHTEGRVSHALCHGKSGLFAVAANVFIDATGDGDLAVMAGADFAQGDGNGRMMAGTLCSLWADIDWDTVRAAGLSPHDALVRAFADGVFTHQDRHLPGIWRVGQHTGGGNIGHTFGVDGTDERSLTAALLWGRQLLTEYERFYKDYLRGFQAMELVGTGALLGIRETRRILGDYVLNLEDFRTRAVFADEIGRYAYPVDIHAADPGLASFQQFEKEFHTLRYGEGESYGIPYRILTPRGLVNVLVAGRCVSTDRYLQSSLRVMPGCYITGQAAGIAATLAMDGQVHNVAVTRLQETLRTHGAFLPTRHNE